MTTQIHEKGKSNLLHIRIFYVLFVYTYELSFDTSCVVNEESFGVLLTIRQKTWLLINIC